jgi:hypothetical protein
MMSLSNRISAVVFFLVLALAFLPATVLAGDAPAIHKIDTGDTAWILVSTALVMLMTPGLAMFYGGMVRSKNVLRVWGWSRTPTMPRRSRILRSWPTR